MNPYLLDRPRPVRVANVGHRGAMGLRPENTLPSFELAFDQGAHMVELDVHLSSDGHPVVIHDDTVARTSDAGRRHPGRTSFVSELTLAELRELDAGTWFVESICHSRGSLLPPRFPTAEEHRLFLDGFAGGALASLSSGEVRIPTLEEVLVLARSRGRLVNVELKAMPRRYARLVPVVVDVIRATQTQDLVLLSSFDHVALVEAKRLAPELPTAALVVARLHDPGRYVAEVLGGDAWNPGCVGECDSLGFGSEAYAAEGVRALDRAGIESAHARGVSVHTWTANDPAQMRALIDLGVDGIITDFPNRLASLLDAVVL